MPDLDYNALFPGIRIRDPGGASTFFQSCREALDRIRSQPVGHLLLNNISASPAPNSPHFGSKIVIIRAERPISEGGSRAVATNDADAQTVGTGTSSAVFWNSNVWDIPEQGRRPPFIGLAHELIHAWHNTTGHKRPGYDDEENFTVGLGPYMIPAAGSITENMIRLEHGIPIRHRY